jgi:myo-inositol-1(or 4)-monophosphatase
MSMKELILAKQIAKEAGSILRRYYEKDFEVRKKAARDLVTEVDERVQRLAIKKIQKEFKGDLILAEEGEFSKTSAVEGSRRWIIDPLDGTTNFRFGYPMFCVSIAFEINGVVQAGVVYEPIRQEMFWAKKGSGSFRNRKRIRVRPAHPLSEAFLVTGFPYDLEKLGISNFKNFEHLMSRSLGVRRDGSAALNLAYVACGRFSGLWEFGLKPWDVAAGILLVREAGGHILPLLDQQSTDTPHAFVAGEKKLCQSLLKEIRLV